MQEISMKILKQRIAEIQIKIPKNLPNKLDLAMKCKVNLKAPKNEDEKSILLNIELEISTKSELRIEMNADVVFEIDEIIDNYDEFAEKKLIPTACKSLLNSLDVILVEMGYKKMELANEIKDLEQM